MIVPYEIIKVPHPVLKSTATAVDKVDDSVREQMRRMLQTMYEGNGIGLAANQVGLLNRVIVMDLEWRECGDGDCHHAHGGNPIFLANPHILWTSEEFSEMDEGCLSIPGHYAKVQRPAQVRVSYLDVLGEEKELEADGLLSHCVQHEIDHLNGVLFIDHISSLKRNMILKKLQKDQKHAEIL